MRSDIWTPDNIVGQEIIDQYAQGKSARQLGFDHSVADVTISAFLKRNNTKIRNRSEQKRKWTLNEKAFDKLSPEAFYWIGFLLADGNVHKTKTRSWQLCVGLAAKDSDHIEKFKKFIGCNKPLYFNEKNGGAFLIVYSNYLCERLAQFGMVPNKSKIVKIPEVCKNNRDFWRGMVDGDGWLTFNNSYPTLGLCGTLDVINNFLVFVNRQEKIRAVSGIYQVNFGCTTAQTIARILYENDTVSLTRKEKTCCEFLRWKPRFVQKRSLVYNSVDSI